MRPSRVSYLESRPIGFYFRASVSKFHPNFGRSPDDLAFVCACALVIEQSHASA